MRTTYEYDQLSVQADAFRQTVELYAAQGWRVISVTSGATEWLDVFLERPTMELSEPRCRTCGEPIADECDTCIDQAFTDASRVMHERRSKPSVAVSVPGNPEPLVSGDHVRIGPNATYRAAGDGAWVGKCGRFKKLAKGAFLDSQIVSPCAQPDLNLYLQLHDLVKDGHCDYLALEAAGHEPPAASWLFLGDRVRIRMDGHTRDDWPQGVVRHVRLDGDEPCYQVESQGHTGALLAWHYHDELEPDAVARAGELTYG